MNNYNIIRPRVIVRAWGDEPVELFLYSIDNNICYVGSGKSDRTIGIPRDQVFVPDSESLSLLRGAYECGDRGRLATLYAQLSVDESACNRYQDVVASLHDQENIENTGSITSRSER